MSATRMFVPFRYQPGYVVEEPLHGGWQYCILIDAEMVVRDSVYSRRSEAVSAMISEVNELNHIYGRRAV